MTLRDARSARNTRSAVKAATLKIQHNFAALAFLVCTLLMLASVIRMWSHWFEISAIFGFYKTSVIVSAITGAALIVSWWVNTDND